MKRELPPESSARASVSREELLALIDAFRVYYRRATNGRQDSEHFYRAKNDVERALERLPAGFWE